MEEILVGSMLKTINKSRRAKQKQVEEMEKVIKSINAVKMVSLLVLRDEGWGETRLRRFGTKFNTLMADISENRLSLSDIPKVLEEETGLNIDEMLL